MKTAAVAARARTPIKRAKKKLLTQITSRRKADKRQLKEELAMYRKSPRQNKANDRHREKNQDQLRQMQAKQRRRREIVAIKKRKVIMKQSPLKQQRKRN